jgi:hypothetical protein
VHAPQKCILFLWLAILGHCWTSKRCHRHGFQDLVEYALCAQAPEHIDHLLAGCPFMREVWFLTFHRCGWHDQTPTPDDMMSTWWLRKRKEVTKDCHKAFDLAVTCVVWSLWLKRNERVFRNASSSAVSMAHKAWALLQDWCRVGIVARSMLVRA